MTRREWTKRREDLFSHLKEWCGEIPARGNLEVEEIWRREYGAHTEIKLTYEGDPGERIPAYLLLPRSEANSPLPAILAAHQCACFCDIGKEQVVGKCVDLPDQAYGLELVRKGFVVLAPDANKVGERYDPTLREAWQTAFRDIKDQRACCTAPGGSWGPIRWKRVFDAMRGIDLLCSLEAVDSNRIGMIGHSLGADTILWTMPLDARIRAAVISGGGLMHDGRPYGLPYADILSLLAPRPFLEVTGYYDYTNCEGKASSLGIDQRMQKKRDAHSEALRVYKLLGSEVALRRFEFDGGHEFPQEARDEAYTWLIRWLMRESHTH